MLLAMATTRSTTFTELHLAAAHRGGASHWDKDSNVSSSNHYIMEAQC